jgi:hypothetical protein
MNDSSTGGYLTPLANSPVPLDDDALYEFLQPIVVGVVGTLPGSQVIPRWQPEAPVLPAVGTNWAALGVETGNITQYTWQGHHPGVEADPTAVPPVPYTPGYDIYHAHEDLNILLSFYGPLGRTNAALWRDGIQIEQNREVLLLNNMGLVVVGPIVEMNTLVKGVWLRRYDISVTIRRELIRWYGVLDLVGADMTVNNEEYVTSITVTN